MLILPPGFQRTISVFSAAFRKDVWPKAELLLTGAIICPGSRTVCNLLRSVGLQAERSFPKFHRLLNRDKWSAKWLSGILLKLLVDTFVQEDEALVFGLDDTIECRWGSRISKRGIYRDPVRSSKSHFVKCSGLRWLSLMLLTTLPWLEIGVFWALPILTALCPSERYYHLSGKQPKKLTDWAGQIITWLRRRTIGLNRSVYLVGDGTFATYELFMHAQRLGIGMIARMKFNARLFHLPPSKRPKGQRGPKPPVGIRLLDMQKRLTDKRVKWKRLIFSQWYNRRNKEMLITSGVAIWHKSNEVMVKIKWVLIKDPEEKLEPVLLGCTDIDLSEDKIVSFFVRRWRIEVSFAEVRRHLGVESQRQWSDLAIERSTPCLMALMSIICLMANTLHKNCPIKPNATAWYHKKSITLSDVITAVRFEILRNSKLSISHFKPDIESFSANIRHLWFLLTQTVA
jgi:DDE superfamily endonuclease